MGKNDLKELIERLNNGDKKTAPEENAERGDSSPEGNCGEGVNSKAVGASTSISEREIRGGNSSGIKNATGRDARDCGSKGLSGLYSRF